MSANLTLHLDKKSHPVHTVLQKTRALPKSLLGLVAMSVMLSGAPARAVVLTFQDILIPGGFESFPFPSYTNSGFTLTAINPSTGFTSGFQAHGPNSIFYAGAVGVVAFSPASGPDNVISLTQDSGEPFSLASIALARNFPFDPAPTVTFTGTQSGGGVIVESFTVTTAAGLREFQTFDFSGFTDLESVTWGQPVFTAGLHQFTNIDLVTSPVAVPVPEPASWLLILTGLASLRAANWRRRQRSR